MNFLSPELDNYVEAHSSSETALLKKINRDTNAQVLMPRMLSGHLQGNVLTTFARMIRPKRILEIGTFTGYSAICLAQGLAENGLLYTIDINEELENRVRNYFAEAGLAEKIYYLIGNATELIPKIEETWDLVFIDADKANYAKYYDLVFDKVRKGGFIIADNVLWSGKVLAEKADKDTENIKLFNQKIQQDERVFNTLFPIRDGLMVAEKLV